MIKHFFKSFEYFFPIYKDVSFETLKILNRTYCRGILKQYRGKQNSKGRKTFC